MIIGKEALNPDEAELLGAIRTPTDIDEFVEHLRVNRFAVDGQAPLLLFDYPEERKVFRESIVEIAARPRQSLPSILWEKDLLGFTGRVANLSTIQTDTDMDKLKIKDKLIRRENLVTFLVRGEMFSSKEVLFGEVNRYYSLYQAEGNYLPETRNRFAKFLYGDEIDTRNLLYLASGLINQGTVRQIIWRSNQGRR